MHIPPLIDIQSTTFAQQYVSGVCWRLFGWRKHGEIEAQGPLPEHYLIDNLKICARLNRFDGCHDEPLRQDIGFFLGMLHGGEKADILAQRLIMASIKTIESCAYLEIVDQVVFRQWALRLDFAMLTPAKQSPTDT